MARNGNSLALHPVEDGTMRVETAIIDNLDGISENDPIPFVATDVHGDYARRIECEAAARSDKGGLYISPGSWRRCPLQPTAWFTIKRRLRPAHSRAYVASGSEFARQHTGCGRPRSGFDRISGGAYDESVGSRGPVGQSQGRWSVSGA